MITAQRAFLLLTGAAMAVSATPALAQVPDSVTLNIMRECAKIDDPTARLACYDNNIRAAGGNPHSIPGQMARPNGGGAVINPNTPGGFGANDLKTEERFHPYAEQGGSGGPREISTRVSGVAEREPGVYLVTLEGGAQWLFAESTSRSYLPPKRGDTIRIEHGALGSYMMVVNHQQGVKVTRVK
jgi:hypothetical protein